MENFSDKLSLKINDKEYQKNLANILSCSEQQLHQTVSGEYSRLHLHAAFDLFIPSKKGWKEPHNGLVNQKDFKVTSEAAAFFSYLPLNVIDSDDNNVLAEYIGYYAAETILEGNNVN